MLPSFWLCLVSARRRDSDRRFWRFWRVPLWWLVVGTLDDRGLLHHQIKLFVGMLIAASVLLASGIHAQVFSAIWPGT